MAKFSNEKLFKALRELGIIPKYRFEEAMQRSKEEDLQLEDILIREDLISDANLGKTIAELRSLPFVQLSNISIDLDILTTIPEPVARKQRIIAYKKDEKTLSVAMNDPDNDEIKELLERKTGLKLNASYTTNKEIEDALVLYTKDAKSAFKDIVSQSVGRHLSKKGTEPSIIKIVDMILRYAYQSKASDIHIEPFEEKSIVRFRIDGILHDILDLPLEIHPQVVTRIKVLARLRTDEHSTSQDGKIIHKMQEEDLDIRVSVVPITNGEKIVMRMLSERSRQFSLAELGFSEEGLIKIKKAYSSPHGMILVTGPTGSGKTTTLYAILKLINKRDVNIMTVEDPVEYNIQGVNQIQVNEKTDLSFSKGLRSIVRQDPDVILVGEIRDEDTAAISVNAAMTGHLVLSTLHANDAPTAIPRLIDLKVEPFLVASTINIIIAQRLVRKICMTCRISENVSTTKKQVAEVELKLRDYVDDKDTTLIEEYFGTGKKIRAYRGKGCDVCHHTGYRGRVGIFEIMLINDEVREYITAKKDANEIRKVALRTGMSSMFENGLEKVREGVTTIDEVLRVSKG